jgi:hypothetical protein
MMERQYEPLFRQRLKTNIFYADGDTLVRMACLKAKHIGKSDNLILRESARQFQKMFFAAEEPSDDASKKEMQIFHFRSDAARQMDNLVDALKNTEAPVKREVVRVRGGC